MSDFNSDKMTRLDYELLKSKYSPEELSEVLKRVDEDYPVQYAIGNVDFLGSNIDVDERVLIPRFETELLVSKLVNYIDKYNLKVEKIADFCTGSGCIAISLAKRYPEVQVLAVDVSDDALDVARSNAKNNEVDVKFLKVDVLNDELDVTSVDILISNPPYVKLDEIVSANTKYEPSIALYPGEDDTIFYEVILDKARNIVNDSSIIAFEIGSTQGEQVAKMAQKYFPESKVSIEKDYAGLDRFVFVFNGIANI